MQTQPAHHPDLARLWGRGAAHLLCSWRAQQQLKKTLTGWMKVCVPGCLRLLVAPLEGLKQSTALSAVQDALVQHVEHATRVLDHETGGWTQHASSDANVALCDR